MFNLSSSAETKEEKAIDKISKISKIINDNYNTLNSSSINNINNIPLMNNQVPAYSNTTINNYLPNGNGNTNSAISIVQISNAVQSVGKISKRGRPPKNRLSNNYNNYKNYSSYSSNSQNVFNNTIIDGTHKGQNFNNQNNFSTFSNNNLGNNNFNSHKMMLNNKEVNLNNLNEVDEIPPTHSDENKNFNDADLEFINAYIYDESKKIKILIYFLF
jgi:hypothetical protein